MFQVIGFVTLFQCAMPLCVSQMMSTLYNTSTIEITNYISHRRFGTVIAWDYGGSVWANVRAMIGLAADTHWFWVLWPHEVSVCTDAVLVRARPLYMRLNYIMHETPELYDHIYDNDKKLL